MPYIASCIQGRKQLFKFHHIVSAEIIQERKLLFIRRFQTTESIEGRKVFKGENYMRKYGICFLSNPNASS